MKTTTKITLLLALYFHFGFSQSILKEGKGIGPLTLGIKESKVIRLLGTKFDRKNVSDNEFVLYYPEKLMSFSFDQDSIVYEIVLEPEINIETAKGLQIKPGLEISDVEEVYGQDWWTKDKGNEVGYDIGITFKTSKNKVQKIIIQKSDLEEGNDYSFYEYIKGIYIPKNLEECFLELDAMLGEKNMEEIKMKGEEEFRANAHFGLGLWMRNNWGLWKGSRLHYFFKTKGILHPDDMSGIILTSYHRSLNDVNIKLKKQIRFYQKYWKKQKED